MAGRKALGQLLPENSCVDIAGSKFSFSAVHPGADSAGFRAEEGFQRVEIEQEELHVSKLPTV